MRKHSFALAGAAGTLVAAGAATAGFTGFDWTDDYRGPGGVWDDHGYSLTGLRTYRVYVTFDGLGDDGVLAVFGQPGDLIVVESTDGVFHNDPLGGLTAPIDLTSVGIWQNQWDTYVTVGATTATGDATGLSPGFATVTNDLGTNWSNDNAGWFVTPVDDQSIGTNVLVAQFVVDENAQVGGTFNVLTRENETFKGLHTDPAAPGVLGLLVIAGLGTSRRRSR